MTDRTEADLAVVGGGIVGLATAWQYTRRFPGRRVIVLEKESAVAAHQTGHNSGVLHSGIYYRPGSEKARNCRRGVAWMEAFCREQEIPIEICGKVIVATSEEELPRLSGLYARGIENGVDCEEIGPERLRELEPHAAGLRALLVREAGILDYRAVCERLAALVRAAGGEVRLGTRVVGLVAEPDAVRVETGAGTLTAARLVNCAGLHADRVRALDGGRREERIVPFRGEYWELAPEAHQLVRNLIYPVPDPAFPFLGVHFTRMIGGGVECGPNAVLALAREGYGWTRVNAADVFDTFTYPGFWRLARRHWRTGFGEVWRSWSKAAFVRALQRLVPAIETCHLRRVPAGVRAQALAPNGGLVDDFLIRSSGRLTHVLNAPSPAATSSLSIGDSVVDALAAETPT